MSRTTVKLPDMCFKHQSLLCLQTGYKETDPWRSLVTASQIALFQAMTADPLVREKSGGDIAKLAELGCFACYKPDVFGEIVEAGKSRNLGDIKALGESYINKGAKSERPE